MDIVISGKSEKPIYEQVYGQIAAQILSGELPADFCLPSIRNISKETGISVITIKKAYEMLESGGLIYTRAGIGCFVCPHKDAGLEEKKFEIARGKIKKDIEFYVELKLSKSEFISLAKDEYPSDD